MLAWKHVSDILGSCHTWTDGGAGEAVLIASVSEQLCSPGNPPPSFYTQKLCVFFLVIVCFDKASSFVRVSFPKSRYMRSIAN